MTGIKPIPVSRERADADPILSAGLKIRRRSTALMLVNVLCIFPMMLGSPPIDVAVAGFSICAYAYSRTFRLWEKKNADYLRKMGFDVK